MEDIDNIKTRILELHIAWDAISDDDDSLDGLKEAECIESKVEDLIISYCEERKYAIDGLRHYCFNSSNFAFMVGLPWVSFLMVKSSALLLARRKLFSEDSSASLVF